MSLSRAVVLGVVGGNGSVTMVSLLGPVRLLGIRDIVAPLRLGVLHHLISDLLLSGVLEGVDPTVADTIRELFLLSPEDVVGKTIRQMQVLDTSHGFLVERVLVRSSVEVQVTAKDLVTALATQNHLDTHSLDLSRQEVHGGRGSDGGDVVSLEVEDNVRKSVETVLDGKGHDMVLGPEELSDLKSGLVIGRAWKTDGERVELGKVGKSVEVVVIVNTNKTLTSVRVLDRENVAVGLKSLFSESGHLTLGDGGSQTRIKTTGKKNTERHLSHESLSDGLLKSLSKDLVVDRGTGNLLGVPPRGVEVASGLASLGVVDMAGRESDDLVANAVQTLQLGGEVDGSRLSGGPALVKCGNTDRVASGNRAVLLLVVEDK
ncbi:hypothetical protein HG531_008131 [Fusarium graminearum]|nr:hypothetical protein HG531_008131 [Fusarium graminearum]